MPTTTRVVLLQRLSELLGDWWSAASTGGGDTGTVVDSKLAQLSSDTDFCLDWYVRKVSTDEVRRITGGYNPGTTTITHAAFPLAVGNGNTYELHRYDPTEKHLAISRAIEELFPVLYLPLIDETLFVDNVLTNGDFETVVSGGALPSWTDNGAGTLASTTNRLHGAQAFSYTPATIGDYMYQQLNTLNPAVANRRKLTGVTWTLRAWCHTTVAKTARIALAFTAGGTPTYSSYHTGDDHWEELSVSANASATSTIIEVRLVHDTLNPVRWDLARLYSGNRITRYTLPTTFLTGPHYFYQQATSEPWGRYEPLDGPVAGRILRLEGMGLLSRPTTDAGTVEVGPPQSNLILAKAAEIFWRIQASPARSASLATGRFQQEIAYWKAEVERMKLQPGVRMSPMGAKLRKDLGGPRWHIDEDSSGRYLVLDR